ncbi:hypothetical protein AAZX31_05G069900 [Glycine max]
MVKICNTLNYQWLQHYPGKITKGCGLCVSKGEKGIA